MATVTETIVERVLAVAARPGGRSALVRASGLPKSTVYGFIDKARGNPSLRNLQKLEAALDRLAAEDKAAA